VEKWAKGEMGNFRSGFRDARAIGKEDGRFKKLL